jgi:S1-C subfamily serine protease
MIVTRRESRVTHLIAPRVFVSLTCCLVFQLASAKDAESVFADALDYTVRIKTTISTPFIEDTRGVFTGAGFVVDSQHGWVMTNAHVVSSSPSKVQVALHDESYAPAEKIYVDPYLDLAVLALGDEQKQRLQEAPLKCDAQPGTGHPVGAFGHPWGLEYTGTQGVISGNTANFGGELLQTDAPINGGNSGGPLISLKSGAVVGINTSSISGEDAQNTNFAVSMQHACRVLELLAAGQDPSPPELPVVFYNMAEETDPLIVAKSYLEPEFLALQSNDEILFVGDTPIENEGQLIHALRGALDDINLTVRRDGETVTLEGRLLPAQRVVERRGIVFAGILLAPGGFRDQAMLGLGHDIMVHAVRPGTDGQGAAITYYDYLVSIDGIQVRSLEQAYETLAARSDADSVQLDFMRVTGVYLEDQIYNAVRREIAGSMPEKIGAWEVSRVSRAE